MPASPRETVLCRYHYDPVDRQAGCTPYEQAGIQRFYCKSRLTTEIHSAVQCSIFQHDDQLLAQWQSQSAKIDTTLLATDQQRSVLNALDMTRPHPIAYTPYGHRALGNGLFSLLGFNGEPPDPVTGHYHLGNGYRQFNPVLMRFNSPDSWSPFGKGGLNAYGYCDGDPRNRADPSGHFSFLKSIWRPFTNIFKSSKSASARTSEFLSDVITKAQPIPNTRGLKSYGKYTVAESPNYNFVFKKHNTALDSTKLKGIVPRLESNAAVVTRSEIKRFKREIFVEDFALSPSQLEHRLISVMSTRSGNITPSKVNSSLFGRELDPKKSNTSIRDPDTLY